MTLPDLTRQAAHAMAFGFNGTLHISPMQPRVRRYAWRTGALELCVSILIAIAFLGVSWRAGR